MATLQTTDTIKTGDQFVVWSQENNGFRGVSTTDTGLFLDGLLTINDDKVTQYASPSSTGFTVAITDSPASIWLILTPTGTMATGTITLPAVGNCVDRQEVLVNSTQTVTTLTIGANGATVTGGPSTIAANGFFRLRFDAVASVWYRVG